MLKADQAHPKLALRPDDASRLAQLLAGGNQVEDSSPLADPAVFTRRGVTPAHSQQALSQLVEIFQVQGDGQVNVAGVTLFVREVVLIGDGADDDQIALKLAAHLLKLQ